MEEHNMIPPDISVLEIPVADPSTVRSVELSPGCEFMAVAFNDSPMRLRSLRNGRDVQLPLEVIARALVFNPSYMGSDCGQLAIILKRNYRNVILLDLATLEYEELSCHGATCAAFSPDGKHLLIGTGSGQILVWNAEGFPAKVVELEKRHRPSGQAITSISCHHQSRAIYAVTAGGHVLRVTQGRSERVSPPLPGKDANEGLVVACHPRNDLVVSGGFAARVCFHDANCTRCMSLATWLGRYVHRIGFMDYDLYLIGEKGVQIWMMRSVYLERPSSDLHLIAQWMPPEWKVMAVGRVQDCNIVAVIKNV
jgi:WD40 repeat protein